MIGKTETVVAMAILGVGYSESRDYFEDYKNTIVDYYCDHYQKIYEADTEAINPQEIYDEIFQTCADLKALVLGKDQAEENTASFENHLKRTSKLRKRFYRELSNEYSIFEDDSDDDEIANQIDKSKEKMGF
tara:strand:- start:1264 stop:1659 length:396 start_codon:yes stop_codon:yes gene_type:complete